MYRPLIRFVTTLGMASLALWAFSAGAATKATCLLVDGAVIAPPVPAAKSANDLERKGVEGHQLVLGDGTVFLIREFEDPGQPDTQQFTKLTLEYPRFPPERLIPGLESAPRRASYTRGSVAFAYKGHFWMSTEPSVKISLGDSSGEVTGIRIMGSFPATRLSWGDSSIQYVDIRCTLKIAQLHSLTLWEGKVGSGWELFTPPDVEK